MGGLGTCLRLVLIVLKGLDHGIGAGTMDTVVSQLIFEFLSMCPFNPKFVDLGEHVGVYMPFESKTIYHNREPAWNLSRSNIYLFSSYIC